jgi:hypothetical protein
MLKKLTIILISVFSVLFVTILAILLWYFLVESNEEEGDEESESLYCVKLSSIVQAESIEGNTDDDLFGSWVTGSITGEYIYTLTKPVLNDGGFVRFDRNDEDSTYSKNTIKYMDETSPFEFIVSNADSSLVIRSGIVNGEVITNLYDHNLNLLTSMTNISLSAGIPVFDSLTTFYQGFPNLNQVKYYSYSLIENTITHWETINGPDDINYFGNKLYVNNNTCFIQGNNDNSEQLRTDGVICVYSRETNASSWTFVQTLSSSNVVNPWVNTENQFGQSVTLFGKYLFIGCNATVDELSNAGGVLLYILDNGHYTYSSKISSEIPVENEMFGLQLIEYSSSLNTNNYVFVLTSISFQIYKFDIDTITFVSSHNVVNKGQMFLANLPFNNKLNLFTGLSTGHQIEHFRISCIDND